MKVHLNDGVNHLQRADLLAADGVEKNLHAYFERQATRVADYLRQQADEVERHARVRSDLRDGSLDYVGAATEIMRDLQRAVGNAPMDSLMDAAKECDRYARLQEGSADGE